MKSPLIYLFLRKLKNNVLQILKSPPKLIYAIIMIALVVFVMIIGGMEQLPGQIFASRAELTAGLLAFFAFLFISTLNTGISSGTTIYSMADVNWLFAGPFPPQKVLIYGLSTQMGTSLLMGVVLLYQYGWMGNRYGITPGDLLAVVIAYAMLFFLSQLTAMALYILIDADEQRRKKVKAALYGVLAVLAAVIAVPVLSAGEEAAGGKLALLLEAANKPWIDFVPVLGWCKGFFTAVLLEGSWAKALLWLIPSALYVAVLVLAISKAKADYYEDVLATTERNYAVREAAKAGRIQEGALKTKVGKSGMARGHGASAFFYKHLTESRRESVIDKGILINVLAGGFFVFLMKDGSESDMVAALIFTTYMQIFTINLGRWNRELTKPYIYLVPQSNFKKLLAILGESFLKQALDAVIVMTVVGLILQLSLAEILACIATRYGFALVLLAGNIFAERVLGGLHSKSLILTLYFLMMILVAAPGLVLAFVAEAVIPGLGLPAAMLVSVAWNVLGSALLLFLCRNVLQNPEMNQG